MANAQTRFFCPNNDSFYASNKYQPLSIDEREIRLLELQPGSGDSFIECALLQPVNLDSPELQYLALSYCAGDPNDVECIRFQGSEFNVFKPVGRVLRRIRSEHESVRIWIDQLCIDQSNVLERGHQVSLMGHIYSKAQETIAWLGHEDPFEMEGVSDLIRRIIKVRNECALAREGSSDLTKSNGKAAWPDWDSERQAAYQLQNTIELADIENLLCLTRRPWWSRCWVIQEAVLSPCVTIFVGSSSLRLEDIESTYYILQRIRHLCIVRQAEYRNNSQTVHQKQLREVTMLQERIWRFLSDTRLFKFKWPRSQRKELPLLPALINARGFRASDLRDHIYAILGVVQTSHQMTPSYAVTNSTEDVFTNATRKIIEKDAVLNILLYASKPGRDCVLDLPSWVPNFSTTDNRRILNVQRQRATEKQVHCKVELPMPHFTTAEGGEKSSVLSCCMISLDCIARRDTLGVVGKAKPGSSRSIEEVKTDWRTKMFAASQGSVYSITGESLAEAFENTLYCGRSSAKSSEKTPQETQNVQDTDHTQTDRIFQREETLKLVFTHNRLRFFASPLGYIGIAPALAQEGDILAILFESYAPYVLRPMVKGSNCYTLVGEVYVHGIDALQEIRAVYENGQSTFGVTPEQIWIY